MTVLGIISHLMGGVGLFLVGMKLLSDGLKAAAGSALHTVLERWTTSRISAFFSGLGITALIQSSSATTVATIGFVSAGLLTLNGSLGVIVGANVGTTSTGWLVSLLGFKVSVGALALPLIGVGALGNILLHGRRAHLGMALAGFGIIFVGIDFLQSAMSGAATRVDLSVFGADTIGQQLVLVLVGMGLTAIVQSSSVAIALTLTALASGAIGLQHAVFLVIGQNLGTTITAALAAVGASVPARRAATGHILFNLFTGTIAFVLAAPLVDFTGWLTGGTSDMAIRIAAFHTTFNVLGAILALPLLSGLVWLVVHLVPDRTPSIARNLDKSLLLTPAVAIEAAHRALHHGLRRALHEPDRDALFALRSDVKTVLGFVASLGHNVDDPELTKHRLDLVHAGDHLNRLIRARLDVPFPDADTPPYIREFQTAYALLDTDGVTSPAALDELRARSQGQADQRRTNREKTLEQTAMGEVSPDTAQDRLLMEAWRDRVAYHAWRCAHHLSRPGSTNL